MQNIALAPIWPGTHVAKGSPIMIQCLFQISSTAFGACGGPYVGIFMLGAIFPRANWIVRNSWNYTINDLP